MAFNMNAAIRSAGNRSRMLPDIGQGAAMPPPRSSGLDPSYGPMSGTRPTQAGPPRGFTPPMTGGFTPSGGGPAPMAPTTGSPMQAPRVQPQTFTMHPPGSPADPNQYNYEPQPDGSWRVYPPGVSAPHHTVSASLPRAASTGDYIRLSKAFQMAAPSSGASPQPEQVQSMPAPPSY